MSKQDLSVRTIVMYDRETHQEVDVQSALDAREIAFIKEWESDPSYDPESEMRYKDLTENFFQSGLEDREITLHDYVTGLFNFFEEADCNVYEWEQIDTKYLAYIREASMIIKKYIVIVRRIHFLNVEEYEAYINSD